MTDTHIKIKPVVPKVQYTGNGVTTDFPYTFAIFDETDMVVYLDDDIIESGYTITGAGETDGGYVIFDTAPDDGVKITLLRNVPIERLTDFQEGGTFRPKNLNDEFDRQTAFCQQVQESLSRAVVVDPTSDVNPEIVKQQITRVYESADNIDAVANDLENINTVAPAVSDISAVAPSIDSVVAVAGALENIEEVKDNADNVNTVAANISDVQAVAAGAEYLAPIGQNLTDISTVASDLTGSDTVGTVASNISDVAAVGSNISNVNAVNANKTNIDAVANNMATIQNLSAASANLEAIGNNLSDISTVAADLNGDDNIGTVVTNMSDINRVGSNITNVVKAGSNSTNITAVAANKTNIDTVATNLSDISAVATNITNVNAVANNETKINTVASSSSDIETVADNISTVGNVASNMSTISNVNSHMTEISQAITSAGNAQKWAEGSDADVSPLGGTHSAKGWANTAQGYVTSCQNYAASASSSATSASNSATSASDSASSASSSAAQALANSMKLLIYFNPARAWSRTYTDLETEKVYQFVTCSASDESATLSQEYTTEGDISTGVYQNQNPGAIADCGFLVDGTFYYNGKTFNNVSKVIYNGGLIASRIVLNNNQIYQISPTDNTTTFRLNGTYDDWDYVYYNQKAAHIYFGVRDGKLYSITITGNPYSSSRIYTATLLDDTGTWTYVNGNNVSGDTTYWAYGVKDGKLYKISNFVISLLDDTITWTPDIFYNVALADRLGTTSKLWVISNNSIYCIRTDGVYKLNSNIVFTKYSPGSNSSFITNDGKLYYGNYYNGSVSVIQCGTDTDWQEVASGDNIILALKGGNIVRYNKSDNTVVQLTTDKSYIGLYGSFSNTGLINTAIAWSQQQIVKTETVYTTPTSTTGNYLYKSTALASPTAITAIDSSTVTGGGYTYTRNAAKDSGFSGRPDTFVSTTLTTGDLVDALS